METFSALLALCERNPPVIGGFPSQSQWCAPEQTAEQTVDMMVIWDALALWNHCNVLSSGNYIQGNNDFIIGVPFYYQRFTKIKVHVWTNKIHNFT